MNSTKLNVEGMSCASCVHHVDEALRQLSGVTQVEVRLREGEVLVRHDTTIAASELVAALREAGYEATAAH